MARLYPATLDPARGSTPCAAQAAAELRASALEGEVSRLRASLAKAEAEARGCTKCDGRTRVLCVASLLWPPILLSTIRIIPLPSLGVEAFRLRSALAQDEAEA